MSSTVVFLVISAATVIIAASLVPEVGAEIEFGGDYYCSMIAKAFQVLEGHQWQIDGARGAKKQLENFQETVKRAKEARTGGEWLFSLGMQKMVLMNSSCGYFIGKLWGSALWE